MAEPLRRGAAASTDEVERMRAFVVAVLAGSAAPANSPIDLIKANHLGPIAFRMGVPELRQEYAASLIMAERRAATVREVTRAFAARDVRPALLKGSSLVGVIYPDAAQRPMNDIDLLVRTSQLPIAVTALQAVGFVRVGFSRKLSDFYHATVFARGDMMVELHRNIVQPYRTAISIDEIWSRTRDDHLGSGAARMDPIDDLLLCIVHIARHELAVPALSFVDVWRMWSRLDDSGKDQLRRRARDYRVERAVAAVLAMMDLLATGRPGQPSVGRGSRILPSTDDVLRGSKPARLRQIGQKLLLAEGMRERVGLGFTTVAAIVDGWVRARSEPQR